MSSLLHRFLFHQVCILMIILLQLLQLDIQLLLMLMLMILILLGLFLLLHIQKNSDLVQTVHYNHRQFLSHLLFLLMMFLTFGILYLIVFEMVPLLLNLQYVSQQDLYFPYYILLYNFHFDLSLLRILLLSIQVLISLIKLVQLLITSILLIVYLLALQDFLLSHHLIHLVCMLV